MKKNLQHKTFSLFISIVMISEARRRRSTINPELPEDVIENILSFLSLKELCSLSVLSKRFRYTWKCCRHLCFDRNFAANLTRDEYRSSVNNFFSNHTIKSAETFKLYYDATSETSLVSHWIDMAVSHRVKEFELDLTPSKKKFTLSYDLVNSEAIRVMKLVNCELHLPLDSNGLCFLREITFQEVRARPALIQALFKNCVALRAVKLVKCSSILSLMASSPSLQTLSVNTCSDVHSVAINAPSLRGLYYHGKITEFVFYCDLPCLNEVILEISHPRTFQLLPHRKDMVNSLASVETLTITSTFLEGLCARFKEYKYKDMELILLKLKEFNLFVAPESFINPSDIAIFLKKCPYIEKVFINLGKNAFGKSLYWENYGRKYLREWEMVIPFLKYVKIKGFTAKELPVSMARYFLKNAVELETLVIVKARTHYFPEFYTSECLSLGIISNAVIQIYDYNRDTVMPTH